MDSPEYSLRRHHTKRLSISKPYLLVSLECPSCSLSRLVRAPSVTVPNPLAVDVRAAIQQRVGGYFRNCVYIPGVTCRVCFAPSPVEYCETCLAHTQSFGDRLADSVQILTYAQGWRPEGQHQSAYVVRAYKRSPPVDECVENMHLVARVATILHGRCIEGLAGLPVEAVTFVPSAQRPGPDHPVAGIARKVRFLDEKLGPPARKFLLQVGDGIDLDPRSVRADRFVVPEEYRATVEGRHALIVDDTWTSGAKMQSASLAVKACGARYVTALVISRWLNWDWQPNQDFIKNHLLNPYDPLLCPCSGTHCAEPNRIFS